MLTIYLLLHTLSGILAYRWLIAEFARYEQRTLGRVLSTDKITEAIALLASILLGPLAWPAAYIIRPNPKH